MVVVSQVHQLLDAARLLHDLQRVREITQSLRGDLEPGAISTLVTDALVQKFHCSLARIWLLEPDQTFLRLVASSGLYTHLDGSFAQVPMGAYKVGKIAQNRIPFLSNRLPEEPWVKDRQWALENRIQGFAGYPLMTDSRVLGVLATFSQAPFAPEFLEVLQVLCITLTVALDAAHCRRPSLVNRRPPLSDQVASLLPQAQFMLIGTEPSLPLSISYLVLSLSEVLQQLNCSYCRLSYGPEALVLEAIANPCPVPGEGVGHQRGDPQRPTLAEMIGWVRHQGGQLETTSVPGDEAHQFVLELPYRPRSTPPDQASVPLSHREREILQLLAAGKRDRDIAQRLFITESTVKFHIHNSLVKLKARNRYQGVYQATRQGWI